MELFYKNERTEVNEQRDLFYRIVMNWDEQA